jgi:uncharacterized RDD family membrane protein YckC
MEKLWGKRFFALLIDAVAVTLVIWILSALIYPLIAIAGIYGILNYWLILAALMIIGYFTYLEGKFGTTLGKKIVKIKVVADNGNMDYKRAFKRNLSKILWFPLIIDVIAGYKTGDFKIRYLDKYAGTNVIEALTEDKKESESSAEPESTA